MSTNLTDIDFEDLKVKLTAYMKNNFNTNHRVVVHDESGYSIRSDDLHYALRDILKLPTLYESTYLPKKMLVEIGILEKYSPNGNAYYSWYRLIE